MIEEQNYPKIHQSKDPQKQGQTTVNEGTGPGYPKIKQ